MQHLGLATTLMFNRAAGSVTRAGRYTVVRTPDAPDFHFGNLLVLDDAPSGADRARLEADFDRLVGSLPGVRHRTFLWPVHDNRRVEITDFTDAGYAFDEQVVLVAGAAELAAPSRIALPVGIRPFRDAADWDDWEALNIAHNADDHEPAAFRRYLAHQRAFYEALGRAGRGDWWGAFLDGRQVAHLGLSFEGGAGRFQSVFTVPEVRNRGICRALVHHAARIGFARAGRLVMVADEHYHAARIYESLGFAPCERMASLCRWPRG